MVIVHEINADGTLCQLRMIDSVVPERPVKPQAPRGVKRKCYNSKEYDQGRNQWRPEGSTVFADSIFARFGT